MSRRPLVYALGALLLASLGLASAQDAYTSRPMNVRAGPNRDYPLVAQLDAGAPLDVHGCLDDWSWCDVSFDDTRDPPAAHETLRTAACRTSAGLGRTPARVARARPGGGPSAADAWRARASRPVRGTSARRTVRGTSARRTVADAAGTPCEWKR